MTNIYMVAKPCHCSMLTEPHAHAPGCDLIPWHTMQETFRNIQQKETDIPFIVEEDCIKFKIADQVGSIPVPVPNGINSNIKTVEWNMPFPYPFSIGISRTNTDSHK